MRIFIWILNCPKKISTRLKTNSQRQGFPQPGVQCISSFSVAWYRLAIVLVPAAKADVVPNPLFTDHAVLQRDKPIFVWGTADPGEQVRVSLSNETGTTAKAQANADGRWMAELPALPAGGPYTLSIQGKNKVQLKDVLIGEVWICSGQSNMEWQDYE